jgi:hypothetical protein
VGVLDLLRRRSRDDAAGISDTSGSSPDFDSIVDSAPEMRGDFMLLPPLRPTFSTPPRIQHSLDDFLVTHRPTAVTNEPLAHDIDPQRLGMVRANARRSTRPRPARDPLVHRRDADVEELEFDEPAQQLPAATPPRRLKASATKAAPVDTVGELPSVSSVHRSVSAPSINTRSSFAPEREEELSAVREASRAENSTDAPVMRRRGGAALPETAAPIPATAPPMMGDDDVIDLETLEAPSAADIPPLTGGTRVRGAQPPGAIPPSRPLVGSQSEVRSPDTSVVETATESAPEELVHRVAESVDSGMPDTTAPIASPAPTELTERTGNAPPSAGTTSPSAASPAGESVALTPTETSAVNDERAENLRTAPAAAGGSRSSRSLLGERAPLVGPGSATPSTPKSPAKPGAAGRTGVQRKARAEASTAPTASVPPPAPTSRTIDVPPEVRKAVSAATGQAPDAVTVHEGAHSHAETQALNAEAFTRDGEIYLAGDASLDSPRGQALLAHELTHVVQQRGGTERMPDETTREGRAHEEAALKVERALAKQVETPSPSSLDHARGSEPSGSAPVNAPQGVQRRGKEIGSYGSINRDDDDDDDASIGMPAQPEPAIAHASVQQPSVLEQVDLIHAGQAPPVREDSDDSDVDSDRSDYQDVEGDTFISRQERPAARKSPGRGAKAMNVFERMMQSPAAPKAKTQRAGGGSSPKAPAVRNSPTSTTGPSGGADSGGSGQADSTGDAPRPEPGPKEKALDYFSRMMLSPEAPQESEAMDDRRGELERQADTLYPYLRSRLRAELVRDRERRGRLAREWR